MPATIARLLRLAAWAALLAATGLLARAEARRSELPEGVAVHRDLVYRDDGGRRSRLDVYVPAAEAPPGGWPALIAIHGGGWRGGSKGDYGRMIARLAADPGPAGRPGGRFAVVAVDYRLSRPGEPSWPANLDDVREAVRWVRRHAADYHIDAGRIAAIGASAGGHLAALLGTEPAGAAGAEDPGSSRVAAVVDFYGPTDLGALTAGGTQAGGPVRLLLGGTPDELPGRAEAASPARRVAPGASPMLLIHGTDDALVPLDQSRRLAAALDRAGVQNRLVVVEGAKHGFGLEVGGRDLAPEIASFLEEVWSSATGSPARGEAAVRPDRHP